MTVPFLTGDAAVQVQLAATQANATANIDTSRGSVTLALAQAVKGVVLWLQALVVGALAKARLGTSYGADVDSWVADIGMTRLPAVTATGSVVFSRNTVGVAALVPVGAPVSTGPGGTQFVVTTDSTNPAYSAAAGGYVIPATIASVTVPVACMAAGVVGNVAADAIGSFARPILYVDNVTNLVAFTNGLDAESDASVKTRVPLYTKGLRGAVDSAILFAAASVQQSVKLSLLPAYPAPGYYTLYADDGSGAAPDSFIQAITAAVQAVTSDGVLPIVMRPVDVPVTVNATLALSTTAVRATVDANVSTAVAAFVAAMPIGGTLPYLQLGAVVFGADPGIAGITSLTVNGAMVDVPAGVGGLLTLASSSVA